MIRFISLFIAVFLSHAAMAQDFPALFRVTNVSAGDVLNIRAEASARSNIVGQFTRTQVGIEVIGLSEDRNWGLVRTNEAVGWTSMRYLTAERSDSWRDGQQSLTCSGTEPFWTLHLYLPTNGGAYQSLADGTNTTLTTDAPALPTTFAPPTLAVPFTGGRTGMAVIRNGVCSDGMSDYLYGLETQVYFRGQTSALSGCCTLAH
ncbi:hypothetical protein [Pararhodobacter zhoushanensis]|uniref:SH3 domain-containing protein n=1 Tax=Pararhodobacter zhoushanensis TaxID=2479545 RepID=A0ABT3GUS5_9RHOB|nr:hypothetical protein [Pararhodobacter zhoushanensis]MCW1931283.1 hypothetical protein [Pararhodobacter zhoushanensis]